MSRRKLILLALFLLVAAAGIVLPNLTEGHVHGHDRSRLQLQQLHQAILKYASQSAMFPAPESFPPGTPDWSAPLIAAGILTPSILRSPLAAPNFDGPSYLYFPKKHDAGLGNEIVVMENPALHGNKAAYAAVDDDIYIFLTGDELWKRIDGRTAADGTTLHRPKK
ncbi:MAG: hypothetical protein JSR52_04215 [Planctomycetes bacterium]|nr:hypothetical protein [Planctomycetota bacterium]